jgi:hypothetical protein
MSPEWTDGNALAGPLGEVFAVDITTAIGTCVGCGRTGLVAEVHVYAQAPGVVARCPSCDTVLIRMVRTPDRAHLDLRGLTSLTFLL